MSNQKEITNLIRAISGQANILTIPRVYISLTRSHRAALLLSQCVYWSDRTADPEGWFWKTDAEWRAELGLTRRGRETALKALAPWVATRLRRVGQSPKTHYCVDLPALAKSISDLLETRKSDLRVKSKSTLEEITLTTTTTAAPEITEISESDTTALIDFWHVNVQPITAFIAHEIRDAAVDYSAGWVRLAMEETTRAGVRSWKYTAAILERCRRQNTPPGAPKPAGERRARASSSLRPAPVPAAPPMTREQREQYESLPTFADDGWGAKIRAAWFPDEEINSPQEQTNAPSNPA